MLTADLDKLILGAISEGHTSSKTIVSYVQSKNKVALSSTILSRLWKLVDRGTVAFTLDGKFERSYRV